MVGTLRLGMVCLHSEYTFLPNQLHPNLREAALHYSYVHILADICVTNYDS